MESYASSLASIAFGPSLEWQLRNISFLILPYSNQKGDPASIINDQLLHWCFMIDYTTKPFEANIWPDFAHMTDAIMERGLGLTTQTLEAATTSE